VGIYAQKKLNKLDEDNNTQDWDEFVKELKTTFSDKSKAADADWKNKTIKFTRCPGNCTMTHKNI